MIPFFELQIGGCERTFRVRPLALKEIGLHDAAISDALKKELESGTGAAVPMFLDAAAIGVDGLDRAWCMENLHEGQLVELAYLPRKAAQAHRDLLKNSVSPSA